MKVALIYPRLCNYRQAINGGFSDILFNYPPLGLAYVAAIIKNCGHEPLIIDGNVLDLGPQEVISKIKQFAPDFLGFSVTISTFHGVYQWVKLLKRIFNIPVLMGGPLVELYPEQLMQHKDIDYAFIGTAVKSLTRFLAVAGNNGDFSEIPGLCFRRGDRVIVNQKNGCAEEQIEELPFPARELLPNHRYCSPFSQGNGFTSLVTSVGCKYKCSYCFVPGPDRLSLRSVEDVINEIKECCFRFNIWDIDICDALFTEDKERVIRICQEIRAQNIKFRWRVRAHIESVDEYLLREMSVSGCKMIMYGIESLNSDILAKLGRKPLDTKEARHKISLTRKYGISSFGFFMLGCPGETEETMKYTVTNSNKLGLDLLRFSRFTLLPGTQLYRQFLKDGNVDYWDNFLRADAPGHRIFLFGTALSTDLIERSVKYANAAFFFSGSYIAKALFSIKSARQFVNYVKVACRIFLNILKNRCRKVHLDHDLFIGEYNL